MWVEMLYSTTGHSSQKTTEKAETKGGKKYLSNKDKSRIWHLDLNHLPKHSCKNTDNNSQGNMLAPESSHPTKSNPKYPNTVEVQENGLKINFMMMKEILKEEMKDSIKENKKKTIKN